MTSQEVFSAEQLNSAAQWEAAKVVGFGNHPVPLRSGVEQRLHETREFANGKRFTRLYDDAGKFVRQYEEKPCPLHKEFL